MQFQCAKFEAPEIKRVLRMLNSELKDLSLTEDVLESVFAMWWPTLEKQVGQLLQYENTTEPANVRSERELLEAILDLSRSIAERQSQKPKSLASRVSKADGVFSTFTYGAHWSGALTLASIQKRMRSGGNLAGANLMDLNLARLDLSGANLRGSNLCGANLSGTKLTNADLDGANLEGATLDGADLRGATISRANLWHASMRGVQNLSLVKSMDEANFFEVDLNSVDRKTVAEHNTLSIENYSDLFAYYRRKGMTKAELGDVFLWTAHSYPGAESMGSN